MATQDLRNDLQDRRLSALRAWNTFVEQGDGAESLVRPEILKSWLRSRPRVSRDVVEAPLDDESDARAFWHDSPLQRAVSEVEDELRRTAEDGDLVLAVTDQQTRILWTYGGRVMRRKAESVNFVPAARWDDESVGTNALDLANRLKRPAMVFSAEHYAPIVHNWVCWAAPVHDPVSGRQLGVVDLSTTWDRTHPIGLATARVLARLIETAMPRSAANPMLAAEAGPTGLQLRLLGNAEATLDGSRLLLNRRQTEILAILAKMIKQRQESAHAYEEGGRLDLAAQEEQEVAIIRDYLPRQMSEAEVEKAIAAAIADCGACSVRDMGKVMATLKARHPGKMDFARAGAAIKQAFR